MRRFNDVAGNLAALGRDDIGRPVAKLIPNLGYGDLVETCLDVLATGTTRKVEARSRDGHYYVLGIASYQTLEGTAEGVVLTLSDVTALKEREAALRQTQRRLALALDAAQAGVYEHDVPVGPELYYSGRWTEILGYTRAEMPAPERFVRWLTTQIHPDARDGVAAAYTDFIAGRKPDFHVIARMAHKVGHWVHVEARSIATARDANGHVLHAVGLMRDVTEQKETEVALRSLKESLEQQVAERTAALQESDATLRETLAKYRTIFESFPLGITVSDSSGQIIEVNSQSEELLGISDAEHQSRHLGGPEWQIIRPDASPMPAEEYASTRALREQRVVNNVEMGILRPDGDTTWINVTAAPLQDSRVVVAYNDITERKRAEDALLYALREKETLLRELYHRTKNNMQVIIAMLELQSTYIDDPEMRQMLDDMQGRIGSMAMVHQRLYQSEDLSTINLGTYIGDLSRLLMASYDVSTEKIALHLDTDDVFVLIDSAIPCGLVINEVLTNALTHAFPGDRGGAIDIDVHRNSGDEIVVTVADNGVGLPEGFSLDSYDNFGMLIIRMVGESQLRGDITYTDTGGVTFELRFKDNLYQPRV